MAAQAGQRPQPAWTRKCVQGTSVGPQALLDVAGAVPEPVTQSILAACSDGAFARIQQAVMDAISDGWPVGARHAVALL